MLENQWCLKREKRQAGVGLKTKVNCESILKKQIYPMTKSVWFIEEEFIFVHFRAAESYKLIISNFLFTQKPTETLVLALFWSPRPLNILKDHKAKHDEYRKQLQWHFSLFLSLSFALFVCYNFDILRDQLHLEQSDPKTGRTSTLAPSDNRPHSRQVDRPWSGVDSEPTGFTGP